MPIGLRKKRTPMSWRIAVLGAGSFGVALAKIMAENGRSLTLWTRRLETAKAIRENHCHPHRLPQIILPRNIHATHDLEEALHNADLIVSALPMSALRAVFQEARGFLPHQVGIVSTTKGVELESWQFPSEVLHEILGPIFYNQTAFLSGPSFALEVANNLPTSFVVASASYDLMNQIARILQNETLCLTMITDVVGLEVCGAFKNVVAIAAGLVEGLGLGTNAKAALVTKGLHEISKLATALGGNTKTVYGLSGVGDLVLTCYGALSRNRSVGLELAAGRPVSEVIGDVQQVAEGVYTAKSVLALNQRFQLNLPILTGVHQILFQAEDVKKAIEDMLV
jgi:glycerol-3-phosphate dehydrogenase (NAD(P)+)